MTKTSLAWAVAALVISADCAAWGEGEKIDALAAQMAELRTIVLEQTQNNRMLQEELRRISGENEVLSHQLRQMQDSQHRIQEDFNQRLDKVEKTPPMLPPPASAVLPPPAPVDPPPAPVDPPPTSSTPPPALPAPPVSAPDSQTAYDAAFRALQTGQYDQAIQQFESFTQQHNTHPLAGNGYYWLGESYYAKKDFTKALRAFNQVLDQYPESTKRNHALLKAGFAHYEMNDKVNAKRILQQAADTNTDAAITRLAEERLARLRAEGY